MSDMVKTTYLTENNAELWMQTPGFEDLLLTGPNVDEDGNTFRFAARGTSQVGGNLSWGSAEPIDIAVQRWMTDGALAYTQGYENRTLSFALRIYGETSRALAFGEAALHRRSGRTTLLKWVPMEGYPDAPASIFEVWTWHLEQLFDQDDEMRLSRIYMLTLTAKPWVRSEELTAISAVTTSSAPTLVSIDQCTSSSGWTGSPNAVSSSGGSVREIRSVSPQSITRVFNLSLTRTGSVSGFTSAGYLMLDLTVSGGSATPTYVVSIDNKVLVKAAQIGSVVFFHFPSGVTSFTSLRISATYVVGGWQSATLSLLANDVSRSDAVGGVGSTKQATRHMDVGGSVPTSGSIQIVSPTELGTVLIHTSSGNSPGYTPALRRYRTSGGVVTPDATCASGSREVFIAAGSAGAIVTYTIPSEILVEGTYVVITRILFSGDTTATIRAHARVGDYPETTIIGTVEVPFGGPTWSVVGTISLPTQALPAESQLPTVLEVTGTSDDGGTHPLDEVYLLDVTPGRSALTIVTEGIPLFNLMWLEAPDVDPIRNRPAVYLGKHLDRSDAASPTPGLLAPTVLSLGDHDLDPGGVSLFTVTDKANSAKVTASFYKRWHTNAGE